MSNKFSCEYSKFKVYYEESLNDEIKCNDDDVYFTLTFEHKPTNSIYKGRYTVIKCKNIMGSASLNDIHKILKQGFDNGNNEYKSECKIDVDRVILNITKQPDISYSFELTLLKRNSVDNSEQMNIKLRDITDENKKLRKDMDELKAEMKELINDMAILKEEMKSKRNARNNIINFDEIPKEYHDYLKSILDDDDNKNSDIKKLLKVLFSINKIKNIYKEIPNEYYKYPKYIGVLKVYMDQVNLEFKHDSQGISTEGVLFKNQIKPVKGGELPLKEIGWIELIDQNVTYLKYPSNNTKAWTALVVNLLKFLYELETKDHDVIVLNDDGIETCPGKHGLKYFITPNEFSCDKCRKTFAKLSKMYGCRVCDYDLCQQCMIENCNIKDGMMGKALSEIYDMDIEVVNAILNENPNETLVVYMDKCSVKKDEIFEAEYLEKQRILSTATLTLINNNPARMQNLILFIDVVFKKVLDIYDNFNDEGVRMLYCDTDTFNRYKFTDIIGWETWLIKLGYIKVDNNDRLCFRYNESKSYLSCAVTYLSHFIVQLSKLAQQTVPISNNSAPRPAIEDTMTAEEKEEITKKLVKMFPKLKRVLIESLIKIYPGKPFEFYQQKCAEKNLMVNENDSNDNNNNNNNDDNAGSDDVNNVDKIPKANDNSNDNATEQNGTNESNNNENNNDNDSDNDSLYD